MKLFRRKPDPLEVRARAVIERWDRAFELQAKLNDLDWRAGLAFTNAFLEQQKLGSEARHQTRSPGGES